MDIPTRDSTALLTEREAAQLLNLKPCTLARWRWAGSPVPFIRVGGRAVRYAANDIQVYIERQRFHSTADAGTHR